MSRFLPALALAGLAACGDKTGTHSGTPSETGTTPPDTDTHSTPTDSPTGTETDTSPQTNATVVRGQYLVDHVLVCGDCHTPRDPKTHAWDLTRYLAGIDCFIDTNGSGGANGGCLSSSNLTNDATGLMEDTDEALVALLTTGGHEDEVLFPVMPYWIYANLTPDDAMSIVLYLRTVPGVANDVTARDPLFDLPTPAPAFDGATMPVGEPTATYDQASLDNGRYLATVACLDCHTALLNPQDPRSIDETKLLAGNRDFDRDQMGLPSTLPPHIYSTNLTPDQTGLAGYTQFDVFHILQLGVDPDESGVCPPMPSAGGKGSPYQDLEPGDALDVAAYLLTIPAVSNAITEECGILP